MSTFYTIQLMGFIMFDKQPSDAMRRTKRLQYRANILKRKTTFKFYFLEPSQAYNYICRKKSTLSAKNEKARIRIVRA